jgi:hypothetical protein
MTLTTKNAPDQSCNSVEGMDQNPREEPIMSKRTTTIAPTTDIYRRACPVATIRGVRRATLGRTVYAWSVDGRPGITFSTDPWVAGVEHTVDARYRHDPTGEQVTTEGTFVVEGVDDGVAYLRMSGTVSCTRHPWCTGHSIEWRDDEPRVSDLHVGGFVEEHRFGAGVALEVARSAEGDGSVAFELRLTEGTKPLDGDALARFADELGDVASKLRALASR